jgi:hypothetical protein
MGQKTARSKPKACLILAYVMACFISPFLPSIIDRPDACNYVNLNYLLLIF